MEPFRLSHEVLSMPKTRPPYAPEFRRQMVEIVRAGRDPADLAREFEPSAQAIRNWVAQADRELLPLHLSVPPMGRTLAPRGGENGGQVTFSRGGR